MSSLLHTIHRTPFLLALVKRNRYITQTRQFIRLNAPFPSIVPVSHHPPSSMPPDSSQSTAAFKLIASFDVLEEILLLTCLNKDALGYPTAISYLGLTCKKFASLLSHSVNPAFIHRLFVLSFGLNPQPFLHNNFTVFFVFQTFWTFLKKFHDVNHGRLGLNDLSFEDWNFASSLLFLLDVKARQAYRQLTLYAYVDQVSKAYLMKALQQSSGREDPKTWLAMEVWWATHIRSQCLDILFTYAR